MQEVRGSIPLGSTNKSKDLDEKIPASKARFSFGVTFGVESRLFDQAMPLPPSTESSHMLVITDR